MNTIILTLKYKVSCIMSVGHTCDVGNYTDTLRSIGHNFLKNKGRYVPIWTLCILLLLIIKSY